ncbi:2-oxyglutarate/Fe(II) oxygenase [Nitzschia inconspicua]|uniref:2-oxyglutarate/Fe(II) oxygenase n=1 Tax=Nitzschia inconspicua TaxID=303405 RepID=A0A9K3PT01_9STRA|nr:2-oxyglutarate/Fe(II) oxygenase [Nitzschia inconspicua]
MSTSTLRQQQPKSAFRSILPHEPFDFHKYDDNGYIHLQGAFEPRKKSKSVDDNGPSDNPPPTFLWKTSVKLQQALLTTLKDDYQRFQLPFPVKSIEVVDPSPPYTKVRLQYSTPEQAFRIHTVWRMLQLSPHDLLFSSLHTPNEGNNDAPSVSTHPCQVTMITSKPLPCNDDSTCWSRSYPPKFRRLLHDHNDQEERSWTRFVYVTGLVNVDLAKQQFTDKKENNWFQEDHFSMLQALRNVFGRDVEIFLPSKKKVVPSDDHSQSPSFDMQSCHLGFRSPQVAQRIVETLQGQIVQWEHPTASSFPSITSSPLFLDYVTITQKSRAKQRARDSGTKLEKGEPSRPECTSSTNDITVPGLLVIEDYVTGEQENILMAILTGPQAPWAPQQRNKSQTGSVKRKVQHYGYVFDYQTADVLRDRTITSLSSEGNPANCPPLPAVTGAAPAIDEDTLMDSLIQQGKGWDVLAHLIEKTRHYPFPVPGEESATRTTFYPDINQLTVNQYKPGEGIGSHVDTASAFGDGLISISLNSGIVMEFRKVGTGDVGPPIKKLAYLPSRSLVVMSGPARYEWEHQIVTRRTDTHNGVVLPRGLRVSLTLRTALALDGTPLPRVESNLFPPSWEVPEAQAKKNALMTPDTERDHVHAVYDAIATQWHHTRGKRGVLWPGATQFLQALPKGSVVADVGCGDGKYFPAIWEAGSIVIGTDISRPLLVTSYQADFGDKVADTRKVSPHRQDLQTRPAVAVGDCMSVPFRSKSFDAAICIAVMHHLSTRERRIRCIEELVRIVKPGGRINVQAWAMEQEQESRRRFAAKDVFVPFNAQPKYLEKVSAGQSSHAIPSESDAASKSVAELYSEAYENSDYDEQKGLVIFRRYCHLYHAGEMEEIVRQVAGVRIIESGYESGNHFVILEVI